MIFDSKIANHKNPIRDVVSGILSVDRWMNEESRRSAFVLDWVRGGIVIGRRDTCVLGLSIIMLKIDVCP